VKKPSHHLKGWWEGLTRRKGNFSINRGKGHPHSLRRYKKGE
jgi:hypothetical protein